MATPFAPFASIRMVWERPTAAVTSLRDGTRATVDQVVIEAFLDELGGSGEQAIGAQSVSGSSITGNLTRWAVVPSGASWLDSGASWTWDETGLRPAGLPRGERLQTFIGDLSALPAVGQAEIGHITIATLSAEGGIDGLIRELAGDEFTGTFAAGR
jgi:hypothetical protein